DGSAKLWEAATLRLLDGFRAPQASLHCVAFSPDARTICVGGVDTVLRLWRPGEGEFQRSPGFQERELHAIRAVSVSPDGKRVAWGGDDRTVRIWDLDHAKEIAQLGGHQHAVVSLAFTRNSRLVASASGDGTVLLWDVTRLAPEDRRDSPPR